MGRKKTVVVEAEIEQPAEAVEPKRKRRLLRKTMFLGLIISLATNPKVREKVSSLLGNRAQPPSYEPPAPSTSSNGDIRQSADVTS